RLTSSSHTAGFSLLSLPPSDRLPGYAPVRAVTPSSHAKAPGKHPINAVPWVPSTGAAISQAEGAYPSSCLSAGPVTVCRRQGAFHDNEVLAQAVDRREMPTIREGSTETLAPAATASGGRARAARGLQHLLRGSKLQHRRFAAFCGGGRCQSGWP